MPSRILYNNWLVRSYVLRSRLSGCNISALDWPCTASREGQVLVLPHHTLEEGNKFLWVTLKSSGGTWYCGFWTRPSHLSSVACHPPCRVTAQTPRAHPGICQELPGLRKPPEVRHPGDDEDLNIYSLFKLQCRAIFAGYGIYWVMLKIQQ